MHYLTVPATDGATRGHTLMKQNERVMVASVDSIPKWPLAASNFLFFFTSGDMETINRSLWKIYTCSAPNFICAR